MLFALTRANGVHVQGIERYLLTETAQSHVLQHDGLGSTACAYLQETLGLLLRHSEGSGALGCNIGDYQRAFG